MAPGIKDKYITMTPSFKLKKFNLNLQNLKLGVIVKYLSLIPGAIPEIIKFKH
jgi:hypothetical protein